MSFTIIILHFVNVYCIYGECFFFFKLKNIKKKKNKNFNRQQNRLNENEAKHCWSTLIMRVWFWMKGSGSAKVVYADSVENFYQEFVFSFFFSVLFCFVFYILTDFFYIWRHYFSMHFYYKSVMRFLVVL